VSEIRVPNNAPDAGVARSVVEQDFYTVGVGGTAGDEAGWCTLFSGMPASQDIAFVLMPEEHAGTNGSDLLAMLPRCTTLRVEEASTGTKIVAGTIFLCPTGKLIRLADGRFVEEEVTDRAAAKYPIDYFLKSLAADAGAKAIALLLSGSSYDGVQGLKAVKGMEGIALVQDPEDASPAVMPRNAVGAGVADCVLPLSEIASTLTYYVTARRLPDDERCEEEEARDKQIERLFSKLRGFSGYDFQHHKRGTIYRRLNRRMKINHIMDLERYVRLVSSNTSELQTLYRDLLINVTQFFRDRDAFDYLRQHVFPLLFHRMGNVNRIRVWVPACSTGEEAYSLAMLLDSYAQTAERRRHIQVFASDADEEALAVARAGRYQRSIAQDVPEEFLQRYFQSTRDGYQIIRAIREKVVFASHNLLSDPPFSKIDLVSCRNLLIYLEPEMQDHIIKLFHFSLNTDGHLFLGVAETIGKQSSLFELVSRKFRIYRRIGNRSERGPFVSRLRPEERESTAFAAAPGKIPAPRYGEHVQRVLFENYAPATVLIDSRYQVRYTCGPAARFLRLPLGEPALELYKMISPELAPKLRRAVQEVLRGKKEEHTEEGIAFGSGYGRICLTVRPIAVPGVEENLFLVTFETQQLPQLAAETGESSDRVQDLEGEIEKTRHEMLAVIKELESANESLRASHEDLMSLNEELQSTNEEIETSSEELQSLNEEMTALNQELQEKVEELGSSNQDLQSLLNSTDLAVLLLDERMAVRHFNEPVTRLMNLLSSDIGRPIEDISSAVLGPDFPFAARAVLSKLSAVEEQVRDASGRWHLRRILPYRTQDNRIGGLVVTFTDVDAAKHSVDTASLRVERAVSCTKLALRALDGVDGDTLFEETLRSVQSHLDVPMVLLLERFSDQTAFRWRYSIGLEQSPDATAFLEEEEGLPSLTLRGGEIIHVADLGKKSRKNPSGFLRNHGITSVLSLPLSGQHRTTGVLLLLSPTRREFSPLDIEFLQTISSIIGVGEEFRRAESERAAIMDNLETRLLLRARYMQFLRRMTELSNGSASCEEVLEQAVKEICSFKGWAAGHVYLAQRDETPLFGEAGICFLKSPARFTVLGTSPAPRESALSPLIEKVINAQRAVWVTEFTEADEERLAELYGRESVASAVAFPIMSGEEVAGVVEFFIEGEEQVDQEFLDLLLQIGIHLGRGLERREARQELRARQEFVQTVADAAPFVLLVVNIDDSSLVFVNSRIRDLLGYDPEAFCRLSREERDALVHRDDLKYLAVARERVRNLSDGEVNTAELRVKHAEGAWRWIHGRSVVFSRHSDGRVRSVLATLEDVSERKRLETALADLAMQQQQRIGQELHDGLGQQLAGVMMMMQSLQRRLEKNAPREAEAAANVTMNLKHAHEQVRSMLRGLRPTDVDAKSLYSALQDLAQSCEKRWGIAIRCRCSDTDILQDDVTATQLFLIAQEAIQNAVKHADANQVDVILETSDNEIRLVVRDDGRGIDGDLRNSGGLGHRIMTHRAEIIGAALEFVSGPGTTVTCRLPRERNT